MNVYQKLQAARVELQNLDIRKTGRNTFAGYDYHELSDFLPHINRIFAEKGLCSVITFTPELATLTIINAENPEETIVFTSPMADANLKGCHPIQNLGAVETYQRRYLYTTALEIVEHDALDATAESGGNQGSATKSKGRNSTNPKGSAPNQAPNQGEKPEQKNGQSRDMTRFLTAYHAALAPKMPDEGDRKDLLRFGYAHYLQATNKPVVVVDSTKKVPHSYASRLLDRFKEMSPEELRKLLDTFRADYDDPQPGDLPDYSMEQEALV